MSPKHTVAVLSVLTLVFGTAAKCPAPAPSPTTDAPGFEGETVTPQGPPSCSITERGQNSKGQWYVSFGCTDGRTGAHVLTGPNDLPNCIKGTFWDACAKG